MAKLGVTEEFRNFNQITAADGQAIIEQLSSGGFFRRIIEENTARLTPTLEEPMEVELWLTRDPYLDQPERAVHTCEPEPEMLDKNDPMNRDWPSSWMWPHGDAVLRTETIDGNGPLASFFDQLPFDLIGPGEKIKITLTLSETSQPVSGPPLVEFNEYAVAPDQHGGTDGEEG